MVAGKRLVISFNLEQLVNFFIFLYAFGVVALSANANTAWISDVFTVLLLGVLLIYLIRKRVNILQGSLYIGFSACFVLLSFISSLWSVDIGATISKCITLVQLLAISYCVYLYACAKRNAMDVLDMVMLACMLLPVYTLMYYGWSGFLTATLSGVRVGQEISNVNMLGQSSAVGALGCLYFAKGKRKWVTYPLMALCVIICLGTGSRQALLYLVFSIAVYYFLQMDYRNFAKIALIAVLFAAILYYLVMELPYFEFIRVRIENMFNFFTGSGKTDRSMTGRAVMIERGLESFAKHPILGIGINTSSNILVGLKTDYYTHNNFVEILVSLGIVGFVVYYYRHVYLVCKMYRIARKNKAYSVAYAILITSLIMEYGSVTYYSKMSWLLLAVQFSMLHIAQKRAFHGNLNSYGRR